MRGRALALVLSGLAVGTVFGVPLGLLLAGRWGWRAAIFLIVVLAGLACALAGMVVLGSPAVLVLGLFVWGMCGWASLAPQQHVLLEANPADGATAMAASASANYLGSAPGWARSRWPPA